MSKFNRLLIQISGPANEAVAEQYHPHLRLFLEERGIPSSDISARLGVIEFGSTHSLNSKTVLKRLSRGVRKILRRITLSKTPYNPYFTVFARHGGGKGSTRKTVASVYTATTCMCLAVKREVLHCSISKISNCTSAFNPILAVDGGQKRAFRRR